MNARLLTGEAGRTGGRLLKAPVVGLPVRGEVARRLVVSMPAAARCGAREHGAGVPSDGLGRLPVKDAS